MVAGRLAEVRQNIRELTRLVALDLRAEDARALYLLSLRLADLDAEAGQAGAPGRVAVVSAFATGHHFLGPVAEAVVHSHAVRADAFRQLRLDRDFAGPGLDRDHVTG